MSKKTLITLGFTAGIVLLIISTFLYPGGSTSDINSVGYHFSQNYISDLLNPVAVNGLENAARLWAVLGVLFLTASFGVFFVHFSQRIRIKSASNIIKYLGIGATVLGFLTVIPALHDNMVTLSSALTLLIFFYIMVVTLKTDLHLLKVLSVVFLMTFYFAAYMYFTRSFLELMPLVQKVIFVEKIVWVLSLIYFSEEKDFEWVTK